MHKGDNQGEDRSAIIPEEIIETDRSKILEEIQSIRTSVENLKKEIDGVDPAKETAPKPSAGIPAQPAVETVAEPAVETVAEPAIEAAPDPAVEKVIKALVSDERGTDKTETREEGSSKADDFAAKYRDHMKRQVTEASAGDDRRAERIRRREEHRKEKEQQRAARAEKKAESKRRKKEDEEARRQERKARAKELQQKREIRAEVRRRKKIAHRTAKYGGGVVEYHDTQISTEVQPVANFSLRDLLGRAHSGRIKAAQTEEERESLKAEQEVIAEDARQAASHLSKIRATQYHNSLPGRVIDGIRDYSETHKKLLLSILGTAILIVFGIAGFFNYYTLYEYSYNGQALGYVKNKDDVLRITDMVQKALTTDKDIQVVIDDSEDITFRKVSAMDKDIVADTSDQVLRRLTYMGDLNVKAWGIYVNGEKVGSVQKKAYAADVLKNLEERYSSDKEGAVIEKAEVQEDIEVKKGNTDLRNVLSCDKMTEKLCTSEDREIVHTIVAGQSVADIAKEYQVSEEDILLANEDLDPRNLVAGETILIRKTGPPVTVRITEKRTYEQKIKYETEEKRTDEMYEGDVEVKQEGKNGRERITERTVSINGEIAPEDVKILDRKSLRKPVKKIMIVGTAERPPSVGDGKYIWPMAGGYNVSSYYGHRWGRLHAGIDMATSPGHDVLAADGGIVTRAGYFGGYGLCVDIDHQNGQSSRYAHLSSTLVSPGDEVYEGMHIAESGNSGNSTGPHLHFEIHVGGNAVDPMPYLP